MDMKMNMYKMKLLVMMVGALGLTACGQQWSGKYVGTETDSSTTQSFSMVLVEDENDKSKVTGNFTPAVGLGGSLSGTVDGNVLTATMVLLDCNEETVTGTFTLEGDHLTGPVSGDTNACGPISSSVDLFREE